MKSRHVILFVVENAVTASCTRKEQSAVSFVMIVYTTISDNIILVEYDFE